MPIRRDDGIYISLVIDKDSKLDHMFNFLAEAGYDNVKLNNRARSNIVRSILTKVMNDLDYLNDPMCDDLSKRFDEYLRKQR